MRTKNVSEQQAGKFNIYVQIQWIVTINILADRISGVKYEKFYNIKRLK